jgi:predicted amidohydrolase YtcJ
MIKHMGEHSLNFRNILVALLAQALSTTVLALENQALSPADRVFTNADVITMNRDAPRAEAVAISGNQIVYVGTNAGAAAYIGENTTEHDLDGKTLLPGFISAHDHLIASAWLTKGVSLYGIVGKKNILAAIAEYARANPDLPLIQGIGWNTETFGGWPTAAELDTVVADRPAFILDTYSHDAWLNTAAMKTGNINRGTPDKVPGVSYWKRGEDGAPTGLGLEFIWAPAFVEAGGWTVRDLEASLDAQFAQASANGTTAVQNPGVVTPNLYVVEGMKRDLVTTLELLSAREAAGSLSLRTFPMPVFKAPEADPEDIAKFTADLKQRFAGDKVRVQSVKIHPEGLTNSRTSPMIEPYTGTDIHGDFAVTPERIDAMVRAANDRQLDVVIHTEGDAVTRAAIDAIEASRKSGNTGERNSLHHFIFVHPDDFTRVVQLDIPVNVTPGFTNDWNGQDLVFEGLLGADRVHSEMGRYPELANAGVKLTISADIPSTAVQAPLHCVQAAVTQMEPTEPQTSKPYPPARQGMSVTQALEAITINGAWQLRMEAKIGSIEPGKYADLVVLEKSPYEVESNEIAGIKILATMMDGAFTFREVM